MSTAKILVIDDEPSLLDLVTGYLRKEGHEVQTAMDGSSGFKVARATMNKVKQNLFWAFVYNSLGIPVAAGLFYPFVSPIISPERRG